MKLNEEQRKMVEDNHNLIYWYMNMKNLDIDEWYGILSIELCNAVLKYDPSKSSFANYFKRRADWIVYKEIRKSQSQKRSHTKTSYIENVHSIENTDSDMEELALFKDWIEQTEYPEILKLKLQGYNQTEIGQALGLTQIQVSRILKKLRSEYYDTNR